MTRTTTLALTLLLGAGTAGAFVYQRADGHPVHWTRDLVQFVIQAGGDPSIHDGSDLTAARLAFQAWELPESRLRFRERTDAATRARTDWASDDVHMVVWDTQNTTGFFDDASGLVAVTPLDFDPRTGELLDADIIVDARRGAATSTDPRDYDLQAILTHEVGHFLGLDHSAVASSTMDPRVDFGDTLARSLEHDDRAAVAALYPLGAATSQLSGAVTLEGSPLRGAHVVAEGETGEPAAATLTDAQGRFTLQGLPAGSYAIYAQPLDGAIGPAYFQPGSIPGQVDLDFGTTFYGRSGRSSPAAPERVSVAPGASLALGTIAALPPSGITLTGVSQELYTVGQRAGLTLFGRGLYAPDTLVVSAARPGEILVSRASFRTSGASAELDVSSAATTGLRSVRVFHSQSWACAVLTGGLEVRLPGPVATGISATVGAPGDTLELLGSELQGGARVFMGREVLVPTGGGERLTVTVPALPDGTYDVIIENPDGQTTALRNAFQIVGSTTPADEPRPAGGAAPAPGASSPSPDPASPPPTGGGGGGGGGCALRPQAPAAPPWSLAALAALLLGAKARRRVRPYTEAAMAEYSKARKTQQDRATETRERILKASIECLIERGYTGTTTTEVAKRAGVSRGAQMYHFATKRDLVISTVEYLFALRNEEFRAAVSALPQQDRYDAAIDLLWSMKSSETFYAWLEVQVASRTDSELAASVIELNQRLHGMIRANFEEMFPELASVPQFAAIPEFVFALLDGMALNQISAACDAERLAMVLQSLKLMGRLLTQFQSLGLGGLLPELEV
jgi:AcrR family transcriptional regulator